jgi:hypothetical protein
MPGTQKTISKKRLEDLAVEQFQQDETTKEKFADLGITILIQIHEHRHSLDVRPRFHYSTRIDTFMQTVDYSKPNIMRFKPQFAALFLASMATLIFSCNQQPKPDTAPILAAGEFDRTILPFPDPGFSGAIDSNAVDSKSDFPIMPSAPKGAPNVLLILTDDVGYGASSTFGGPIATPTFDKLAASGLKYNQFHTTALCSPTRAALISGRNHHNVASGVITEQATGYLSKTGTTLRGGVRCITCLIG